MNKKFWALSSLILLAAACNKYPLEQEEPALWLSTQVMSNSQAQLQAGDTVMVTATALDGREVKEISYTWVPMWPDDYLTQGMTSALPRWVKNFSGGFVSDTTVMVVPDDLPTGRYLLNTAALNVLGKSSKAVITRFIPNLVVNQALPFIERAKPDSLYNSIRKNDSIKVAMRVQNMPGRQLTKVAYELVYKGQIIDNASWRPESDTVLINYRKKIPDIAGLALGDKFQFRLWAENDLSNVLERRAYFVLIQ